MTETRAQATGRGHGHIIERPRLTRLLDETTARVITLVAPAGYGKTTLARQWLANRPHVWYRADAASADVASFGIGLLRAAEGVIPAVGHRFRDWLHTRRGTEEPGLAAEMVNDDLVDWPDRTWLVIDDYQWLTPDAEQIVRRLRDVPPLHLLLTSRRRPLWSTTRELLYGEIHELGRNLLSMSPDEATEVLSTARGEIGQEVLDVAEGWPAIIGLVAHANAGALRNLKQLAPALHNYIAEELFSSMNELARRDLVRLSVLPIISRSLSTRVLGVDSSALLTEGVRTGFLTEEGPDEYSIHPLLRSFLRSKFQKLPATVQTTTSSRAVHVLIEDESWDAAFAVLEGVGRIDLLDELLEASLYDLLAHGRLATLSRFIRFGRAAGAMSALLDLAEAELEFREGFHERARSRAEEAGRRLRDRTLVSKAFCRAGHCAYFEDQIDDAIRAFGEAKRLAERVDDEQSAVWGLFLCAIEQEDDAAVALLEEYESLRGAAVDDLVRLQTGRLLVGMRLGSLAHALSGADAVAGFVSDATDPSVRTSFWHGYSGALRIAAEYDRALETSDEALREIAKFDLEFAKAHVYLTRAGVYASTAAFSEALALLDEVGQLAKYNGDPFLQIGEHALRCRIFLSLGDVGSALRASGVTSPRVASSGQYAEFLACRALALGLSGQRPAAFETLRAAESTSRENEAQTLCMCVRSLLALAHGEEPGSIAIQGFRIAFAKRVLDPLVFGIRLDRRLPRLVATAPELRPAVEELVALSGAPGARALLATSPMPAVAADSLTAREQEVYALLARGKSNIEIANLLFVTEATVKVHVRHILRKLGVRTRTEAAILAVTMQRSEGGEHDREAPPHGDQPM